MMFDSKISTVAIYVAVLFLLAISLPAQAAKVTFSARSSRCRVRISGRRIQWLERFGQSHEQRGTGYGP